MGKHVTWQKFTNILNTNASSLYIYYPNWKEMHPLKESQRINYATYRILHIANLYDLVTNCNIQKESASVAISIIPLNAI